MTVERLAGILRDEHRSTLTEVESKELLAAAGVPVVETRLARDRTEAAAAGRSLGFPVGLKICSPQIVHKSDCGGVRLGLNTPGEIQEAYDGIMAAVRRHHPQAVIHGVAVQKMAPPGVETIIGVSRDPHFGHVIMFGLGGVFVEVLKDVTFRIIPVTLKDAQEMITEIKGYPLLCGYRGRDPVNLEALAGMICKVSAVVEDDPRINELDLNPVFAGVDGAVAADARIALAG